MKLSGSNIKKLLIFSQKKAFLIFWEAETPKTFLIFQETERSYVSGNENSKKLLRFQEVTFRAQKIRNPTLKKSLIFQKMEPSSRKLKNQEGPCKAWKSKISYISFHIFCLLRENFSNISANEKSFLYFPL